MEKDDYRLLDVGLNELKIPFDANNIKKLKTFISELLLFNSRFDLVNAKTTNDIIIRHIFDSLVTYHFFAKPKFQTIADIGSGAGFPALPLAIFLPKKKFTLIERSKRRVSFLQNIKAILQLDNINIICDDFEKVDTLFDAITARALTTLNTKVLNALLNLLRDNGELILYKGNLEKTKAKVRKLQIENNAEIIPVKVPFLESERCILKINTGGNL